MKPSPLVGLNHLTVPFCIVCLLSHSRCQRRHGRRRCTSRAFLQYAPQSRFWGKVRSGEVQGDLVGKAAPAGRPKSDCNDNKQEKYGASMAGLEHDPEKWEPIFRKDHAPPKNPT